MSKHLELLYQNLLNGKLPHNLNWSEAVELIEQLGEVQPLGDDEFAFRVGGQRVFFKKPPVAEVSFQQSRGNAGQHSGRSFISSTIVPLIIPHR